MLVYNRIYASSGRQVRSLEELQSYVFGLCARIGDPIRGIRGATHDLTRRGSKTYPTYEFDLIHERKLIDGRLFREKIIFEVIG